MFGWIELGATWPTEQAYRVLEILKQNRIRCRMPGDEMFFTNAFRLPHPDLRWAIQVRRRDVRLAMALLAREGLARAAEETPSGKPQLERKDADPAATAETDRPRSQPSVAAARPVKAP